MRSEHLLEDLEHPSEQTRFGGEGAIHELEIHLDVIVEHRVA
jgi:hypothetical protein